jgi:hypothetical protein
MDLSKYNKVLAMKPYQQNNIFFVISVTVLPSSTITSLKICHADKLQSKMSVGIFCFFPCSTHTEEDPLHKFLCMSLRRQRNTLLVRYVQLCRLSQDLVKASAGGNKNKIKRVLVRQFSPPLVTCPLTLFFLVHLTGHTT